MKSLTKSGNASQGAHFRFRFDSDTGAATYLPLASEEPGGPTDCCDAAASLGRLDLRLSQ